MKLRTALIGAATTDTSSTDTSSTDIVVITTNPAPKDTSTHPKPVGRRHRTAPMLLKSKSKSKLKLKLEGRPRGRFNVSTPHDDGGTGDHGRGGRRSEISLSKCVDHQRRCRTAAGSTAARGRLRYPRELLISVTVT